MPLVMNVPPLGTGAVGQLTNASNKGLLVGAPIVVPLVQGSDLGNGVTAVLASQWTAPCAGFIRDVTLSNYSIAATMSCDVYNSTQAANVIGSQSPSTNAASRVTTITTPAVAEGDVISLRVTTSGGGGASKGLTAWLLFVPTADSTSNQYAT